MSIHNELGKADVPRHPKAAPLKPVAVNLYGNRADCFKPVEVRFRLLSFDYMRRFAYVRTAYCCVALLCVCAVYSSTCV